MIITSIGSPISQSLLTKPKMFWLTEKVFCNTDIMWIALVDEFFCKQDLLCTMLFFWHIFPGFIFQSECCWRWESQKGSSKSQKRALKILQFGSRLHCDILWRVSEGRFKKPEKSFEKVGLRHNTLLWYFVKEIIRFSIYLVVLL